VTAFSPAENESDEFYDWLGVLSNIVRDRADLSRHPGNCSSQTFEEIFTAEKILPVS
jgi:hypothetical protein